MAQERPWAGLALPAIEKNATCTFALWTRERMHSRHGVRDAFSPDPTVTVLSSLRTHSSDVVSHHSSLLTLFRTTVVKQFEGPQRRRWMRVH